MRACFPLLLLAGVAGCNPPADTGDDPVDDTGDTERGDTDTTPPDLVFALGGDWSGTTLTLTWFDLTSFGSDVLVTGGVLYSGAVTEETPGVSVGTPPEADRQEIDPTGAPGLRLAMYLPALHVDTDGDGVRSGEEAWAGVGGWWVMYVEGTVPADFEVPGLVPGWNSVHLRVNEDVPPDVADVSAVPLTTNLAVQSPITLGGTWTAAGDLSGYGLVTIPGPFFSGGTVDAYLVDGPLADPWGITLDGEPPADHVTAFEWLGGDGALEVPVAYLDNDHDGAFGAGDEPRYGACSDGVPVGAIWLYPFTDLALGWQLAMQGYTAGWNVLTIGQDQGRVLDAEARAALDVDEACVNGE
jgi:hypothetical protein